MEEKEEEEEDMSFYLSIKFALQSSLCFTLLLPRQAFLSSSLLEKKNPKNLVNSLTFIHSHMLHKIAEVIFTLITNKASTLTLPPPELCFTHSLKHVHSKKSNRRRLIKALNARCTSTGPTHK